MNRAAAAAAPPPPSATAQPPASQIGAAPATTEAQNKLIQEFSRQSGMNVAYSQMFVIFREFK